MDISEKLVFSNTLGIITDKRVFLNYKSGTESIPLDQVNAVSLHHKRNYFFAVGSFGAIAIILMYFEITSIISIIAGLFFMLSGIANWIGHHHVIVHVGGQNKKPLKVEMAKTKDGKQFVETLKKSILKTD